MSSLHPEGELQVWMLGSCDSTPAGTRYLVEFVDGDAYFCRSDTAYDSDNGGELAIDAGEQPGLTEFSGNRRADVQSVTG